jgi:alpha-tubulin suppressor-like RCC1 family protein
MKKVTLVQHPLGLWITVASAVVASACTPQIRTQLRSFASMKSGFTAVLTWSGPTIIASGSCESYAITNEVSGIPISLTLATTVNLALQGTGAFFSDPSCSTPITTAIIPASSSSVSVYFSAASPQTLDLEASSSLSTAAPYSVLVQGAATQLAFSTEPSASEASGVALGIQPTVQVDDSLGHLVSSATNAITLAAFTDSGCTASAAGTLAATTNPLSASSGVASFGGVTYTGADGTIYLQASAAGLTSACSSAITIGGTATKLAFSTEPSASENSGTALGTQPVIQIQDSSGTLVTTTSNAITLAAFTDVGCTTPASGTFAATTNPLNASSGTATFGGVTYTGVDGTIYIGATASGLTSACSSAIVISAGSASKLIFTTEPSASESSGTALSTQPVVQVEDSSGNFVSSATNPITLAAYTDSGCTAAAAGTFAVTTNPLNASSGTATFSGVTYTGSGTIYIKASTSGLTSACSSAIVIGAGSATQLAFSTEPSSTEGSGVALVTQPVVQVEDSSGTLVSSAANAITLAAYTDVGCTVAATGTFSVTTNPLNASSGAASFAGVTYTGASGTTLYIKATASGLSSACSSVITIGAGTASKLVFSNEPSPIEIPGVAVVVQPSITVEDSFGNTVTTAANPITVAAFTDSGCTAAAAGTLSATTNPLNAASGTANFAAVTYTGSGTIYLKASTGGLTSACSTSITLSVKMVSAGDYGNVCALTGSGTVYCWGDNTYGELGINSLLDNVGNPVQVLGVGGSGFLSDIYSISNGSAMTCALSNAGNVYCWGYNDDGELGNDSTTQSGTPVEVTGVGGSGYLSNIISISAGDGSTCALNTSGNVYCWGDNANGELGNNSVTSSSTPVEVLGVGGSGVLSGITSLGAGGSTDCAVSSAGNVYCWGMGSYGQIGVNTTTDHHTPVEVLGVGGSGVLSGITAVSVSDQNACALSSSGGAYCWGNNSNGEIGNNTITRSKVPVQVLGVNGSGNLSGIIAINTQFGDTCALSGSGNVYCWGISGSTGTGATPPNLKVPQEVVGINGVGYLSNITSLTASFEGGCAVTTSGNVYCWGQDFLFAGGSLGNDYQTDSFATSPVEVFGVMPTNNYLTGITDIGVGFGSTCAIASGDAYCWGSSIGNSGQISSGTPMAVSGVGGSGTLSGLSSIYPLKLGGCALSSAGNVYCWGDNGADELGNGTSTTSNTPVEVSGPSGGGTYLSGVTSVSGGFYSSCAVSGGNVYCWGNNSYGQLGNNTTTNSNLPVEVIGVGGVGYLSSIVSVNANGYTSCALSSAGNVYCWGYNVHGELGNNTTTNSSLPVEVMGVGGSGFLSNIANLGEGGNSYNNICTVSLAGEVYCWGDNTNGQLGNGTTTGSLSPVEVVGVGGSGFLSGIATVSTASLNTCAVTASGGNVYCWGDNADGELGNNSMVDSSTPVEVTGVGGSGFLSGIVSINISSSVSCALATAGEAYCWGANTGVYNSGSTAGNDSNGDLLTPTTVYGVYTPTYLQL